MSDRKSLSYHEQMLDAQSQCVPCKLCGGSAVITDAGTGAGYYIACGNSVTFRDSTGCLINERRLGGWAYNVMDWWNRLHDTPALSTPTTLDEGEAIREAAQFLSDRLEKLEWMDDDLAATCRDYFGHVEPAHERLKALLASRGRA